MSIKTKTSLSDIENLLRNLEETREYSFNFYDFMEAHVSKCLTNCRYNDLFQLLPYFEEPDNYPLLTYSADIRRLYLILQILQWEEKYKKVFFVLPSKSFAQLMSQYYNTVFSLRRIELNLPDALLIDAVSYLTSVPFDIYAAELFIKGEYFDNYDQLYSKLLNVFSDIWSLQDRLSFCNFWEEKSNSDLVYLTLASLFIEKNDLISAYASLKKINNPSTETKEFIVQLKDVLLNESK